MPFVDHLKDPFALLSRGGRVLEANAAFLDLVGVRREDAINRDCWEMEPLSFIWNSITASMLDGREVVERLAFKGMTIDISITPVSVAQSVNYACILMRDVTPFVTLEGELVKRNRDLIVLNAISSAFIASQDVGSVYDDLLERVMTVSDMTVGWLSVKEEGRLEVKSVKGFSRMFIDKLTAGELDFLTAAFLKKNVPLHVLEGPDIEAVELLKADGIAFMALIPLRRGGEILGVLALASRTEVKFDFDLASLLSLVGNNLSLIAEKVLLFQQTEKLSVTDPLTGLYNVRHFYRMLDNEVARTQRYSEPFSLILFDIDNFKSINDTFGHQAGDEVLALVAEILAGSSRQTDIVARYGGEEFIAILPNTTKEEAFNLGKRIKSAVDRQAYLNAKNIRVTLSGGVASCPEDAEDAKSLLYAADMAMYEAKNAGKDRICLYRKQ